MPQVHVCLKRAIYRKASKAFFAESTQKVKTKVHFVFVRLCFCVQLYVIMFCRKTYPFARAIGSNRQTELPASGSIVVCLFSFFKVIINTLTTSEENYFMDIVSVKIFSWKLLLSIVFFFLATALFVQSNYNRGKKTLGHFRDNELSVFYN